MLTAEAIAALGQDHHVALQCPSICTPQLAKDAKLFYDSGHCHSGAKGRGRGDKLVWLSQGNVPTSLSALSDALALLACLAHELEQSFPGASGAFGTPGGPLYVPSFAQFAGYEGSAAYPPHRDNCPTSSDGTEWINDRAWTIIIYLNDGWCATDEGELRIHPYASDGERERLGWEGGRDGGGGVGPYVDIRPVLGTIAIFRTELLHEVLPVASGNGGRVRLALTMWALAQRTSRGPESFRY